MSRIDTAAAMREGLGPSGTPDDIDWNVVERFLLPQKQMTDMTLMLAQEMFDFAGRRLRAQAQFMDALRRCGDFQQLVELQMRYMSQTGTDYVDEAGHVAKALQARAAADAGKPV
jgi:hypothetical protein